MNSVTLRSTIFAFSITLIANKSLVAFFLAKITRPYAPLEIILIKVKSWIEAGRE